MSKLIIVLLMVSFLAACVVVHDHGNGIPLGQIKPAPGHMKKW